MQLLTRVILPLSRTSSGAMPASTATTVTPGWHTKPLPPGVLEPGHLWGTCRYVYATRGMTTTATVGVEVGRVHDNLQGRKPLRCDGEAPCPHPVSESPPARRYAHCLETGPPRPESA